MKPIWKHILISFVTLIAFVVGMVLGLWRAHFII